MLKYLLDFIYPDRCVVCGRILPFGQKSGFLCADCRRDMPWITGRKCGKCGRPLSGEQEDRVCTACRERDFRFKSGMAVFPYEVMHDSIHVFKYRGIFGKRRGLARLMHEYLKNNGGFEDVDFLVPVPMYGRKEKDRGFNQAAELARGLGALWGKPCLENALVRIKDTPPQSKLSPEERRGNILGAFAVRDKSAVFGKKLLIIDDVFTTGSTIDECSKALMDAGAAEVTFFVLSIAGGAARV